MGQNTEHECSSESDCTKRQYCNGLTFDCPKPDSKPFKTLCASKTQICKQGECIGSICEYFNKEPCVCQPKSDKDFDIYCHTCCQEPNDNTTCSSTGSNRWDGYFRGH